MQERPITLQELRNVVRSRRVFAVSALNTLAVLVVVLCAAVLSGLSMEKQAHAERLELERQRNARAGRGAAGPGEEAVARSAARRFPIRKGAVRPRREVLPAPVPAPRSQPRDYPVEVRSRPPVAPASEIPATAPGRDIEGERVDPLAGDEWE